MQKILTTAAVLVAALGLPRLADAATRYVDTASEIESAVATANPGDQIVIDGGSYSINAVTTRDGTSTSPITLRAASGETVILSADDDTRRVLELNSASHWVIKDLYLRGSRHAIVQIEGGTNITIRNCEIYDGTKKGIVANGDLITIEDSVIRDIKQPVGGSDTQGIAAWKASRLRIRRNMFATPGDGVLIGGAAAPQVSTDVRIYDNHFHTKASWDNVYNVENAIDIKNADGVVITDNVIHRYQKFSGADSGQPINIVSHDQGAANCRVDDVRIERNTIYDVGRGIAIASFYGPVTDVTVRKNVFYAVNQSRFPGEVPGGVLTWDADNVDVDNNTFVDVEGYAIWSWGDVSGYTARNNILRRTEGVRKETGGTVSHTCRYSTPSTGGTGDVYGNQRFVNDSGRDYHLLSSSPCIDKGYNIGISFAGTKPDMGRYEYSDSLMPEPEPVVGKALTRAQLALLEEDEPAPAPGVDRPEETVTEAPVVARAVGSPLAPLAAGGLTAAGLALFLLDRRRGR